MGIIMSVVITRPHRVVLLDLEAKSNASASSGEEAINLVRGLDQLELSKYRDIGGIVRYSQSARNSMKDTKQRIVTSLTSQPFGCDNYLIWARAKPIPL